ncbi:MAG TPA: L-threonylcarbamoyladenylate synthase, partial [Verrucomicrobiae bacterium]|nr:L-threonylcarbamoyladenylate synthase [Verrucomicrobiae bacterium]
LLRAGELVAVPTETVYGLAANALEEGAVQRIYEVKGRPARNPIIVHVASRSMARYCSSGWNWQAEQLAHEFWPGPLTIVVAKSDLIPAVVTAGGPTVGIRWPLHPFIQQLINHCGFPIAAPSANLSNQLSPTTAKHVLRTLNGRIPLIVDGGASNVGIESTVVDLSADVVRVLRPGIISEWQIAAVLGITVLPRGVSEAMLKSPGLLEKHYSPRARLIITQWRDDSALLFLAQQTGVPPHKVAVIAYEKIPRNHSFVRVAVIPHDPPAYARAIYSELHLSDEAGAELILVESIPEGPEWEGIRDRLNRASAVS